jgi:hypothetical protein
MHSEDVDGVEEADEDYEEYEDQDDEEATTLSRFSKQSVTLEHLLNLDAGVSDDEDDDDDGRIPPLVYREDVCSDDEDEDDKDEDDITEEEEEADETPYYAHVVKFTVDELLESGLLLVGYSERRLGRAKYATNIERFKAHFGSIPKVCCDIWEDLQTTENARAWVPPSKRKVNHFLMAFHHLKRYPTEFERECIFDISLAYGREWVWYFIEKIQQLKAEKITFPEASSDVFILTVDGTHCWIQEPKHPTWSQDSKFYSHKYAKAGINYELAISLTESKLIWMNGPFKAGQNDKKIFAEKGLKEKLRSLGKRGIGDGGYSGHPDELSIPNPHDSKEVARFKSRALKRHERFNGYTKAFDCLSGRFRHSTGRFKNCFEAVCVICQYQMENGFELFDILLEDMSYEI